MSPRYQEDMVGSLWVDILKSHYIFILVYDLTRYLTLRNFAEQAVLHRRSFYFIMKYLCRKQWRCHCFLHKYFMNLLFCLTCVGIRGSSRCYLDGVINLVEGGVGLDRGNFALRLFSLLSCGLYHLFMLLLSSGLCCLFMLLLSCGLYHLFMLLLSSGLRCLFMRFTKLYPVQ